MTTSELIRQEYGPASQRGQIVQVEKDSYPQEIIRDDSGRIVAIEGRSRVDDLAEVAEELQADTAELKLRLEGWESVGDYLINVRPAANTVEKDRIYKATDTGLWYISDGTNWNVMSVGNRGAVNIATSQSTSSSSFTALSTPDEVASIIMPADGLLVVRYQATWSYGTAGGTATAALFLGSNELTATATASGNAGSGAPILLGNTGANAAATLALGASALTVTQSLTTTPTGLGPSVDNTGTSSITYSGSDNTTGQVLGSTSGGGACEIFAAAGTYTVSVQYKTTSGSVTVNGRQLWVEAIPFG